MTPWTLVADAAASAGLGHLARSSALAGALRELGVAFEARGLGASSPITIDDVEWAPARNLEGLEARAVVLDSYTVAEDVRDDFARGGTLAMFLDRGTAPADATLVVDVGGGGVADKRRLAGLRFACLRPMFRGLPAASARAAVESVLVTTGAGDRGATGVALAQAAARALPNARVNLLRGPYAEGDVPRGVQTLSSTPDTVRLLTEHDLVVTAGGQMLLEAAACGTPAIVVPSAENQLGNAARVSEAGAARVLPPSAEGLEDALETLAGNVALRQQMAASGQAAVDGLGASRVAEHVAAL